MGIVTDEVGLYEPAGDRLGFSCLTTGCRKKLFYQSRETRGLNFHGRQSVRDRRSETKSAVLTTAQNWRITFVLQHG